MDRTIRRGADPEAPGKRDPANPVDLGCRRDGTQGCLEAITGRDGDGRAAAAEPLSSFPTDPGAMDDPSLARSVVHGRFSTQLAPAHGLRRALPGNGPRHAYCLVLAAPPSIDRRRTVQRNPQYEAGYIRAVDHTDPDELLLEQGRRTRLRRLAVVGVLVAAACAAIGYGLSRTGDTPAKQLARGRQLSAANDHPAAIVQLKLSLLDAPDQPAVRFLLGQEYLLLGDAKAAEIEFRKALDLRYEPERTLPLLVASLLQQGRFEKVVTTVNAATLEAPAANADLQAMLGSAYAALGRDADAQAAWKAATDLVPSHPGALLAEADALAARGDVEQATERLARIPATAPRQNEILAVRGDIASANGKADEAAAFYEAAAKGDAGNLPLLLKLAQACVDAGRYDDAKRRVAAILALSRDHPKAQYIAAEAAVGTKDFRAANDAIVPSIQQAPRDGRAQRLAGVVALELARPVEAELHLREAVALLPKDIEARRTLADFYLRKRDAAHAEETIAPVLASSPGDPRVAEIVARIALLQGDAQRAARAYDPVDPTRADTAGASLRAASLKLAAGDSAGALARLRAASAAHPENADLDAALVAAWVEARRPKEAYDAWNVLVRKRPEDARTWVALATIDRLDGDRAAARRSLEKATGHDPRAFAAIGALAALDVEERRVDDARARLRAAIDSTPDRTLATMQLVAIERAEGGTDETIVALLDAAHRADPRSLEVLRALATYRVEHNDMPRALAAADEGLAIAPGDPQLLDIAGNAALATGNAARATTLFRTLTAMDVESADPPARLGRAWLSAGDPEAALAAFRLALTRQPDRVDLHRSMTAALLAAGKADEASRLLFEIARVAPKSPALPELGADVKLARRQYPEAIAAYRQALEATPTSALLVRTVDALNRVRQTGEADALLANWLKAHPTDEAVRTYDVEVALRGKDYARASEDFRALLRQRPNDPTLLRRLAAAEARTDEVPATTVAVGSGGSAARGATSERR